MAKKTVNTFAELKAAVEDTTTDEVILAADITFENGIKIPTTKKTLSIDGNGHTVTDMNSTAASNALYVPTGFGTAEITVKDVVWSGRNYYGVVCVYDDSANSGVSVLLEKVKYNGPQMIYNRYGITIVKNCDVTIEKNGSVANAQEFSEANRLVFQGTNTINCLSTSGSVMWFAFAGAEFKVEADAVLNISAPNTYLIYSDTAAKPKMTLQHGSITVINVKNGLFYASGTGAHILSSCTIGRNAVLSVTSSANNGVPLFKCSGDFKLNEGGSLFLIMPQSGSSPLMYFSSAANVEFDTPKNILLYANGGKVFSFAANGTVSVTAEQINLWTKTTTPYSSAGGFDDIPTTAIFKASGEVATVSQTLRQTTVTATTSNVESGDGGYPVSSSNYDLTKATVFSAGSIPLSVNPINDLALTVDGTTDGDAAIRLADKGQSIISTAGESGEYSVTLSEKPTVGEIVEVGANKNFLTTKKSVEVTGSVSVTKLPDIPFNAIGSPRNSAAINRLDEGWEIELTDTRTNGGKWALYVATESELQSDGNVIAEAVTFTDGETTTLSETPVLVAEGETNGSQKIYLSWEKAKGILLNISPSEVYASGKYVAKLKWTTEFD